MEPTTAGVGLSCHKESQGACPLKSVQQQNGSYWWTGKHWFSIPHSKEKQQQQRSDQTHLSSKPT